MERKFRKDHKLACEDYANLKWDGECVGKVQQILVEKLKRKICADILMNKKTNIQKKT